jgi:hypothetical protein
LLLLPTARLPSRGAAGSRYHALLDESLQLAKILGKIVHNAIGNQRERREHLEPLKS